MVGFGVQFICVAMLLFAPAIKAQPQGPNPAQVLRTMDSDGDGRISRSEWRGPPPRFDLLDRNRDGHLTADELEARPAPAGPQTGPAPVAGLPAHCPRATGAAALDQAWIDTQVHLRLGPIRDAGPILARAVARLDEAGIAHAVVMPQPFPAEDGVRTIYDHADLRPAMAPLSCRYVFLAGNRLNQWLAQTQPERVDDSLRQTFRQEAEAVLASGAAGFGQIGLLHLSRFAGHPFQQTVPDHPLMLLLADIAGTHGRVINVHMQIYEQEGTPPSGFRGDNPARIAANVPAFERLLEHNRQARIVLANFGEDPTGQWTLALTRRLLAAHPNLYLIAGIYGRGQDANAPFERDGMLRRDWLKLVADFPDRFTLGSLQFLTGANAAGPQPADLDAMQKLVSQLPPDLRRQVARDNARRLYGLP